jgi:hypothetical protein
MIYWSQLVHSGKTGLEKDLKNMAAPAKNATPATTPAKTETVPEVLDFEPKGWRPEPGDSITGTVKDMTTGDGGYQRYPIVTLSTADGEEVNVHAFHHTLKNRLVEMRPKRGHVLTITYIGATEQVDKNGKPLMINGEVKTLHRYTVDSPQFEFNWGAFS